MKNLKDTIESRDFDSNLVLLRDSFILLSCSIVFLGVVLWVLFR